MARTARNTDTTTDAKARFVVSLPADLGTEIDTVAKQMQDGMSVQLGFAPELSRAQVITGLVKSALKARENGAEPPAERS